MKTALFRFGSVYKFSVLFLPPILEKFRGKPQHTFYNTTPVSTPYYANTQQRQQFSGFKKNIKKNYFFYVPFLVIVAIVLFLFIGALRNTVSNTSTRTPGETSSQSPGVKSNQTINKTFDFPLRDSTGKTVTSLKYQIESAELREEIVLRGQPGTAVDGKQFLILNLKITNGYDQKVQMYARDYLRLIVDGSDEKLAPDIHNDPLELQPISTKPTRLGFTINDDDKNLELQVGEINGKKDVIKLQLQ